MKDNLKTALNTVNNITLKSFKVLYVLLLCRVNVDFQSQSVCPVGVVSGGIDPDKLPPNPLFVVNITEVSLLHLTWSNRGQFQKPICWVFD